MVVLSWSLTAAFMFFQMRSQLDHYAVQDIETVEGLLYFEAGGRLMLHEDYHNHPESKQVLERYLEVLSPDGSVLYRNARLGNQALGGRLTPAEGRNQYSNRSARLADGTPVRMVSRHHVLDGHALLVRLAYSESPIRARFEEFGGALLLALPMVLGLAGLAGYMLTRSALAPLQEMAGRAERITSERLHERLPVGEAGDELDHLAQVFNKLLARLEQSFEQLRRFTSDASHELRTPLASIRSVGEVALQKSRSREEFHDTIGSMLEEVNRLTALVDSLLTISRADAGRIQLHPTVFAVMDLAREAAGLFEVLVEEKGLEMAIEGDDGVRLAADRMFLRQALANIIHNAVKYSPPGGSIRVKVGAAPPSVQVEVTDGGPGIAPGACRQNLRPVLSRRRIPIARVWGSGTWTLDRAMGCAGARRGYSSTAGAGRRLHISNPPAGIGSGRLTSSLRQDHCKLGALVQSAFHGNGALHLLDHVLDDREAQTGTADLARSGFIYPVETLEDPGQILRRNPDAAIGNADGDFTRRQTGRLHPDFTAGPVEFHGVIQQVHERLLQLDLVAHHLQVLDGTPAQVDLAHGRLRFDSTHGCFERGQDGQLSGSYRRTAGFQLRKERADPRRCCSAGWHATG